MLSKIVSLACVALAAGQVQIEGSPEWQAYKNAELAHIAPSIGPLASVGRNFAQEQLNWQHQNAVYQQNALNFIASGAGRKKRQVQVVGSPEWQAYKNAELAHIAPSIGPLASVGRNFAQEQLNWLQEQQNWIASGAGRKKRQVQVVGSPEWQAYKNAELAHIAPSIGPLASVGRNFAQEQLNWQHQNAVYQQNALNFIASGAGRKKRQVQVVGSPEWQAYKNAELAHIAPSIGPLASVGRNFAQEQLNWLQEQQNWIASGAGRKKRQVQVVGSPEWQAYKNAELAHIAPSIGPLASVGRNFAQEQLNWLQEQQNWIASGAGRKKRQTVEQLAFIAPSPGPTPVNFAQSALNFIAPSPGPSPVSYAQSILNYQQEALNFIAYQG